MGVPALFRWLSRKYPKIVQPVQENDEDMREANPNGEENDMLYLDMNGIVHPCTHPENGQAPKTEEDMMLAIFKYTERVVRMVRPRKLLFMAIDGVAPRAKMNQQRSRRFRSAQEARTKEEERQEAILEWQSRGRPVSESLLNGEKAWDSNAITPGTPFMDLLAASLRYWVAQKMNTDPAWQDLQVIISDASVPGEGEHKIMDYIRRIRSAPEHDANTRHVVYGLDADLIMLSLATHEPYFKVLREDVFSQSNKGRGCHRCGQPGHHSSTCTAPPKAPDPAKNEAAKPFIFLDVPTLREYLSHELALSSLPVPFDLERAIDDWVFLIFFVGNDFLPHLPSLEIREGAIDTLLGIWKDALRTNALTSWVTNHGSVELKGLQVILTGLAEREDEIFRKRKEAEERQDRGEKRRRIAQGTNGGADVGDNTTQGHNFVPVHSLVDTSATRKANMSAAEKLKAELMGGGGGDDDEEEDSTSKGEEAAAADATAAQVDTSATQDGDSPNRGKKRKASDPEADVPEGPEDEAAVEQADVSQIDDEDSDDEEGASVLLGQEGTVKGLGAKVPAPLKMLGDNVVEQEDTVRLYEPGYRERYYKQKFGRDLDDVEFRRGLVKSYVEGLCWVLAYYYQGCPSWQWYYPQHFSPFASDFVDLADLDITFELGRPFRPYEQLLGVFPADSRHHLPEPYHQLMTEEDSPIKDFYPEEFHIDMNGKKMIWQGVALLPFIDEARLLNAMVPMADKLSEDEIRRNTPGKNSIFCHEASPLYSQISQLYTGKPPKEPVPMDYRKSNRVLGLLMPDPETVPRSTFFSPLTAVGQPDIDNDTSISAIWFFPPQLSPHRSVLLPGADVAGKILTRTDAEIVKRGGNPRDNFSRPDSFHASRRDIDGQGGRRGGGGGGRGGMRRNDPYSGYDGPRSRGGPPQNGGYQNYSHGGQQGYGRPMPQQQHPQYAGYGYGAPTPPASMPAPPAPASLFAGQPAYGAPAQGQAFVPPGGFANYGQYNGGARVPTAPAASAPAFSNQQRGMALPPHLQYMNQQRPPYGGNQNHRRY